LDIKILLVILGVIACVPIVVYIARSFSELRCTEKTGEFKLTGQFKYGVSSAVFIASPGRHCFEFVVNKGKLRLSHHSLNPDGFTWSLPPTNGDKEYYDIETDGVHRFFITIGESYDKNDRIELVNSNLWENVEVKYRID